MFILLFGKLDNFVLKLPPSVIVDKNANNGVKCAFSIYNIFSYMIDVSYVSLLSFEKHSERVIFSADIKHYFCALISSSIHLSLKTGSPIYLTTHFFCIIFFIWNLF